MTQPDAPFDEPWQAQLFAMTVALNEAGHFTWTEWADVFGSLVRTADAERYWETWSTALITLLDATGLADRATIDALTVEWQAAARATPHGEPIELKGRFFEPD